jgi:Flp pilus assembly protein TadD
LSSAARFFVYDVAVVTTRPGNVKTTEPARVSRPRIALTSAVLVAGVLLVFGPVRDHAFIAFDDPQYVVDNRHVNTGLSWQNVGWAFTAGEQGNWHPLTWLSHMLDVELFGLDAGGHHLTSVGLHALNTVLLLILLLKLGWPRWRSAIVAALFALHPMHVESVAWVAERKDVLSAAFWWATLLAYVAYVRRPSAARYMLVLLGFAAGLMAKPMVVTLPFVLLLLDFWPLARYSGGSAPANPPTASLAGTPDAPRSAGSLAHARSSHAGRPFRAGNVAPGEGRPRPGHVVSDVGRPRPGHVVSDVGRPFRAGDLPSSWRALVIEKLPLFALAAAASVVTFLVQQESGAVRSVEALAIGRRLATALAGYAFYLSKLLLPRDLAVLYPFPESPPHAAAAAGAALLLAITAIVMRMRTQWPWAVTGWLWFVGTLVPVIGLVQVGSQPFADRYTYLPYTGIFIMIVWGVAEIAARRTAWQRIAAGAALVVVGALAVHAYRQVGYWRDGITLWTRTLTVTDRNYRAHNALGVALEDAGRDREAADRYAAAVAIRPTYAEALNNLAGIRADQGDLAAASSYLTTALAAVPDHVESMATLAVVRTREGRLDEAIRLFERARALRPESADVRNGLAFALSRAGRLSEARAELEAAVRLAPDDPELRANLGLLIGDQGDLEGGMRVLREAIRIAPGHARSHYGLGLLLHEAGRPADAIASLSAAISRDPSLADAHHELGRALASLGRVGESVAALETAVRLRSTDPTFHYDLAVMLLKAGRRDEAIQHLERVLQLDPAHADAVNALRAIGRIR